MTITEMHNYFKLEVDKTSSLELPAFEPEEIDYWLNDAIQKFKETRYSNISDKYSFEENQRRIDDLRTLVETSELTITASTEYTNGWQATIPANYNHALAHEAEISYPTTIHTYSLNVPVIQVKLDNLTKKLKDPFSQHKFHMNEAYPILFYKSNSTDGDIVMITDGNYDITGLKLIYLRDPATVSLVGATDCDLPENTHRDIVKLAANAALENIQSSRYQSHTFETTTMD